MYKKSSKNLAAVENSFMLKTGSYGFGTDYFLHIH